MLGHSGLMAVLQGTLLKPHWVWLNLLQYMETSAHRISGGSVLEVPPAHQVARQPLLPRSVAH